MRSCSLLAGLLLIGSLFAANVRKGSGSNDLEALQGAWGLVAGEIGARN